MTSIQIFSFSRKEENHLDLGFAKKSHQMFFIETVVLLILINMGFCSKRINMDQTLSMNEIEHHCIDILAGNGKEKSIHEMIRYCLSNSSSIELNQIKTNTNNQFTFDQLRQRNVTSEQLFQWSASLDLIEHYQSYLNEYSISSDIFFNCTWPRFGSFCEYSFNMNLNDQLTLNEMIIEYYNEEYKPSTLTCYVHLECNRGSKLICLDWSEICDGYIDCLNGIDEEHCYQLGYEMCEENEYRCNNGECLS